MKKLPLTLLALLLVTGSAWAEWVSVGESESLRRYIDTETIRKDGNLRRVWSIDNYKNLDKDRVASLRTRTEYDCQQERWRGLFMTAHLEPMAGGITLYETSGESLKWFDLPPGSMGETVLKIVCAK